MSAAPDSSMITDYFPPLGRMPFYCGEFKEWVVKSFFTRKTQSGYEKSETPVESWAYGGHYCYHPEYRQRLETVSRCIQICHVFGIGSLNTVQPKLTERAHRLGQPELIKNRKDFEENIDSIAGVFASEGYPIGGMIARLHATEKERLQEAIHCLFEGCRYSTVAMAASAIEFRLLEFMKQANPDAKEDFERRTLGSLVEECLKEPVYSKKLPERHRPLLELCNQFRIFSVHPKTELIGQNEAISVINLAFSFILDERVRKTAKEV